MTNLCQSRPTAIDMAKCSDAAQEHEHACILRSAEILVGSRSASYPTKKPKRRNDSKVWSPSRHRAPSPPHHLLANGGGSRSTASEQAWDGGCLIVLSKCRCPSVFTEMTVEKNVVKPLCGCSIGGSKLCRTGRRRERQSSHSLRHSACCDVAFCAALFQSLCSYAGIARRSGWVLMCE
eukprot:scaffold68454_cov37-Tisochrysis_lutea.AAC.2